jgi:hypothetical protein
MLSESLKKSVVASLNESGVLAQIKAQLRIEVLKALENEPMNEQRQTKKVEDEYVDAIFEMLAYLGFPKTASVFAAESNRSQTKSSAPSSAQQPLMLRLLESHFFGSSPVGTPSPTFKDSKVSAVSSVPASPVFISRDQQALVKSPPAASVHPQARSRLYDSLDESMELDIKRIRELSTELDQLDVSPPSKPLPSKSDEVLVDESEDSIEDETPVVDSMDDLDAALSSPEPLQDTRKTSFRFEPAQRVLADSIEMKLDSDEDEKGNEGGHYKPLAPETSDFDF